MRNSASTYLLLRRGGAYDVWAYGVCTVYFLLTYAPLPLSHSYLVTFYVPAEGEGVTTSLVAGVKFDFDNDNSLVFCNVSFKRLLWRVVKQPVSASRSRRWPDRDRVNCRCTYSSKSSSSRLLIKQFRTSKKTPKITANNPVATNSFHHEFSFPLFKFANRKYLYIIYMCLYILYVAFSALNSTL